MEIIGVPTSAAETLLVTSAVTRVTTNLDGQSNTSPMLLQVLSNGIHLGFGQSCEPFVTDFTLFAGDFVTVPAGITVSMIRHQGLDASACVKVQVLG